VTAISSKILQHPFYRKLGHAKWVHVSEKLPVIPNFQIVGWESERHGLDRLLKTNTTAKRTHSLFRQDKEIVAGALRENRNDNAFAQLCDKYPRH
jgi:hypothetical protein